MAAWARYKSGAGPDRIVLATVCTIMAVAILYLPTGHELLCALPPDSEALFYNIMRVALERKQAEGRRAYSLELVELLLIRVHYLMISKVDHEELWRVLGELVNIATAMGLHRDPGKEMLLEVAERRRWAWWNIIGLERYVNGGIYPVPSSPNLL
jgi:Fungal specific transcription factor domain